MSALNLAWARWRLTRGKALSTAGRSTTRPRRRHGKRRCANACAVVLTFDRCGAYAADQDNAATAFGWGESYASAGGARQRALAECRSRGGSGCMVRVWGCNGPVVEEGLGLDRAARRQIQQGLQAGGFDPGGADGLFGPRTRAAIRRWQQSRGGRATGYLDDAAVAALRSAAASRVEAASAAPAGSSAQENLFWQSIMNSTSPAEFEAYLRRFPNGVFSELAAARLAGLRGSRMSAGPAGAGTIANGDTRPQPGTGFRSDQTCAGNPADGPCWIEVAQKPGCYVWNPNPQPAESVTWTGECADGLAQGGGTLTWTSDGSQQTGTGRLQNGKHNGIWVIRFASGEVQEGPIVDGEPNTTLPGRGHRRAQRESPIPDVALGPLVDLHPARRTIRFAVAGFIGADGRYRVGRHAVRRRPGRNRRSGDPENRDPEPAEPAPPVCEPAPAPESPAGARSPASRFRANATKTPFGNCCRYASKSAGFVLFMIDCQNRLSDPAFPGGDPAGATAAAAGVGTPADRNAAAAGPSKYPVVGAPRDSWQRRIAARVCGPNRPSAPPGLNPSAWRPS